MVSLYDLMMSQQQFSHLTTTIPSLDALLLANSAARHRVYDFQAGPGNSALHTVTAALMVSHLAHSTNNRVVVIDTLEPFPWHYITASTDYDPAWLDRSLVSYTADTFSKLYRLLVSPRLMPPGAGGTTMVVINGFHELMEFYKLELSGAYEETILKNHIERYSTFIGNLQQYQETGTQAPLPEIPSSSDLLTVSPAAKFDAHLHSLLSVVSGLAYKHDSACVLLGHLDTAYKLTPVSQDTSGTQAENSSFAAKGRVVLAPALVGNRSQRQSVALESFITTRLVFYKDWYHNSLHHNESHPLSPNRPSGPDALRMVFAVRVENLQTPHQEVPPVYFDYDAGTAQCARFSFVDLSRSRVPRAPVQSQTYTLREAAESASAAAEVEHREQEDSGEMDADQNPRPSDPHVDSTDVQNERPAAPKEPSVEIQEHPPVAGDRPRDPHHSQPSPPQTPQAPRISSPLLPSALSIPPDSSSQPALPPSEPMSLPTHSQMAGLVQSTQQHQPRGEAHSSPVAAARDDLRDLSSPHSPPESQHSLSQQIHWGNEPSSPDDPLRHVFSDSSGSVVEESEDEIAGTLLS